MWGKASAAATGKAAGNRPASPSSLQAAAAASSPQASDGAAGGAEEEGSPASTAKARARKHQQASEQQQQERQWQLEKEQHQRIQGLADAAVATAAAEEAAGLRWRSLTPGDSSGGEGPAAAEAAAADGDVSSGSHEGRAGRANAVYGTGAATVGMAPASRRGALAGGPTFTLASGGDPPCYRLWLNLQPPCGAADVEGERCRRCRQRCIVLGCTAPHRTAPPLGRPVPPPTHAGPPCRYAYLPAYLPATLLAWLPAVCCARRCISVTQRCYRPADGICLPPPPTLRAHHVVLPSPLDLREPVSCVLVPGKAPQLYVEARRRSGSDGDAGAGAQ